MMGVKKVVVIVAAVWLLAAARWQSGGGGGGGRLSGGMEAKGDGRREREVGRVDDELGRDVRVS